MLTPNDPPTTPGPPRAESRNPAWGRPLCAVLLLALALRLLNAGLASFHLDDFHSLHHARNLLRGGFWTRLLEDNHPPLSFVVLGLVRAVAGEAHLVLRTPNLVYGMLGVALAASLGRRVGGRGVGLATGLLVAVSSLQLELSSDLRMYALLGLTVTWLLLGLDSALRGERVALPLALASAAGLLTQYQFLHALGILGLAVLVALPFVPHRRRALRTLCLGVGGGLLLALPWYVLGFPTQLGHELAPGLSEVTPALLVEGWIHLVFLELSLAGPGPRWVFLAGGVAFLGLAGLGSCLGWRKVSGVPRSTWLLLVAGAFALPLWTGLVAAWLPRAGFAWRYLAGSIAPFCALAAAGALLPGPARRLRLGTGLFVLLTALPLAQLNGLDPGEENYRGAVDELVLRLEEGDALVAADWQPRIFPPGIGWEYYRSRILGDRPEPTLLAHDEDFVLRDPAALDGHRRVFCLTRSLPNGAPLLETLRARMELVEEPRAFGRSIYLFEFRHR